MSDSQLNSLHFDEQPRRDQFRQARSRLQAGWGHQTRALQRSHTPAKSPTLMLSRSDTPCSRPTTRCCLVDQEGTYPLSIGLNSVGRMPDNDVVLDDACVSRRHCAVLVHSDFICELHDMASRNGTFLNGRRLERPTRLENGDEIRLSERVLIFQTQSSSQRLRPPPIDLAPTLHG